MGLSCCFRYRLHFRVNSEDKCTTFRSAGEGTLGKYQKCAALLIFQLNLYILKVFMLHLPVIKLYLRVTDINSNLI